MSYVTIYRVEADGDVAWLGEAKNNHGFAPVVWDTFITKYNAPGSGPREADRYRPLWALYGSSAAAKDYTGKVLSRADDLLLGATFDRVWVPSELVPELIASMRAFHEAHILPRNYVQTIADAADLIEKELDPTDRGIAFNMCSAVESFWQVDDEIGDCRPYNIDLDDRGHWKLTEAQRG